MVIFLNFCIILIICLRLKLKGNKWFYFNWLLCCVLDVYCEFIEVVVYGFGVVDGFEWF